MAVSSVTSSPSSTSNKVGGLVSGMDIDTLVSKLTLGSKNKIFKEQQKSQKLQWKQDAYRQVTAALTTFKNNYFDTLSTTNLRSASFFNPFKAISSSTSISVTATSAATPGTVEVKNVTQLATNQKISSKSVISKELAGTVVAETTFDDLEDKSISISLDGKTRTIKFDSAFGLDGSTLVASDLFKAAFQTSIDAAFGKDKNGIGLIQLDIISGNLSLTAANSKIIVDGETTALDFLGLTANQSNKITTSNALKNLSLATSLTGSTFEFTINDIDFSFTNDDSLDKVISTVNSSLAGVTLSYSSISDKFTMTAKETGAGENIKFSEPDGNNLLASIIEKPDVIEQGKNALLTINNIEISRSSNTFTIDGTTFDLLKTFETVDAATISIKENSTSLFDPIVKFVGDYNNLMDKLNGFIKDTADSDYQPLSDEQKAEMTEDQIKTWETKAKAGILANDSTLNGIKNKLQAMIYEPGVTGGLALYSIGISSAGWQQNGKLLVDETKLKEMLSSKGSDIKDLFTASNGLAVKMNTVLTSAVETKGIQGARGTLIDIAGIPLHTSATQNNITRYIAASTKAIALLNTRLTSEETRYWNQFSAMESAISKLNTQSTMLTSQFSS